VGATQDAQPAQRAAAGEELMSRKKIVIELTQL